VNTVLCDAESSELADQLGPVMLIWAQDRLGWWGAHYDHRAIWNEEEAVWFCLSELLPLWAENADQDRLDAEVEIHTRCPWQE